MWQHLRIRKTLSIITYGKSIEIDGVKQLARVRQLGSIELQDDVHRLIVSMENMWSVLWKIHRDIAEYILQSDNGNEFRNELVSALKVLWPGLNMVHGRTRRPQTQGSVERSNGDFQTALSCWMRDFESDNWVMGLPLIEHNKNRFV